jgi:hypothetical protein
MDGAVGIPQGEGEWGVPLEVGSVDGDFAGIWDWCGGKGLPAGREDDSETKGYQKLIHRLIFSSFAVWVKVSFGTLLRLRSKSTSLCDMFESLAGNTAGERELIQTQIWIRKQLLPRTPGIDSGADANPGILTEADLASSFLERVDEQPEEKPSETEATKQTSETVGAEAEEDSEDRLFPGGFTDSRIRRLP